MYLAHYDEKTGEILMLLNTEKHTELPTPNIPISAQQRDSIVEKPGQYIVNVDNRILVNVAKPEVEDVQEITAQHIFEKNDSKIRGYVDENKVCWMSDDTALMELNLAMNICSIDKTFRPHIHCMIDGVRTCKEVDEKQLLEIAKEIYNIRVTADMLYCERMAELSSVVEK